jgi:hypothetical protein
MRPVRCSGRIVGLDGGRRVERRGKIPWADIESSVQKRGCRLACKRTCTSLTGIAGRALAAAPSASRPAHCRCVRTRSACVDCRRAARRGRTREAQDSEGSAFKSDRGRA